MDYKIIEATTPEKLAKKVNDSMKAGLTPCGGVCAIKRINFQDLRFYQAVVDFQSHADS